MSSFLRKLKLRQNTENTDETAFMMRNGAVVLKELIASSNGKYNPYRIFSAEELLIATNNYDSEKVVKQGAIYTLYKGFWQERSVSVMKFNTSKPRAYGQCINNIAYASQMCHKYILQLIGCCLETEIPILVFEYVNCGTLGDRIRIENTPQQPQFEPLLLTHRLKIAMDIANAVAYLHVGFPRPIIFRDFKTSNILFNQENVAKLFDFSISIAIPEGETHVNDAVRGTLGIFAPEYLTRNFNEKVDVYSFGIFLAELLTGQRAFYLDRLEEDNDVTLLDHMKTYFEENRITEVVDPLIVEDNSCPWKEEQFQAFALLIFECVKESPVDRPTMVDVAKRLRHMYRSCS